jgi:putative Mg2+ transporter-C (MgtC) family protein
MGHEKQVIVLSFMETVHFLGPKLLTALFCGGLIGLERELKSKAAGIKTNMLICVGAMLYTAISILMASSQDQIGVSGDPTRISAQIVSGIGFLGGGAILQSKENVMGLTTAATIWLVAAIGVWIGMGQLEVAMSVSVVIVLVLISVTFFENRFLGRKRMFKVTIHLRERSDEVTRTALEALITSMDLRLEDYRENLTSHQPEIRVSYLGRVRDHSKLVLELWKIPGILDIRLN